MIFLRAVLVAAFLVASAAAQAQPLDAADVPPPLRPAVAPAGPLDRVVADGDYTLTSNAAMGHVSLLRAYPVPLDPPLAGSGAKPRREAMRTSPVAVRDWFAGPAGGTASMGRGLSL